MEAYGAAKAQLFQREELHFSVINFDDPFGRQLFEQLDGKCDRVRYSLHEAQTELWLREFRPTDEGFEAEVDGEWGRFVVSVPLMGSFNASNVLAAMATVLTLGVPIERVQQAVGRLTPPPGRLERFVGANGVRVVVDYAHTPDALANALTALRPHVTGELAFPSPLLLSRLSPLPPLFPLLFSSFSSLPLFFPLLPLPFPFSLLSSPPLLLLSFFFPP